MPDFREYIIGKSPKSDYQVSGDKTVSRVHAKIFVNEDGDVFISDLNSTNGTFVNGSKIPKGGGVKLNEYDFLKVGNTLVPWQDIVENEGVSNEIAIESELHEKTIFEKKKNKFGFAFFLSACFLLIIFASLYFLKSADKSRIVGEWESDGVTYKFKRNGNFSYDSLGIYKEGTWSFKKDNYSKKIKLKFNSKYLPPFINEIKTYSTKKASFGWNTGSFGNIFNLTNKYDLPLKIISFSPYAITSSGEVSGTVWASPKSNSYTTMLKPLPVEGYTYKSTTDHSLWKKIGFNKIRNTEEIKVDFTIPPNENFGFLILISGTCQYSESSKVPNEHLKSDDYLEFSTGQSCWNETPWMKKRGIPNPESTVVVREKEYGSSNFIGSVRYGIMKSVYERSYYFYNDNKKIRLGNQYLSKK